MGTAERMVDMSSSQVLEQIENVALALFGCLRNPCSRDFQTLSEAPVPRAPVQKRPHPSVSLAWRSSTHTMLSSSPNLASPAPMNDPHSVQQQGSGPSASDTRAHPCAYEAPCDQNAWRWKVLVGVLTQRVQSQHSLVDRVTAKHVTARVQQTLWLDLFRDSSRSSIDSSGEASSEGSGKASSKESDVSSIIFGARKGECEESQPISCVSQLKFDLRAAHGTLPQDLAIDLDTEDVASLLLLGSLSPPPAAV